MSKSNPRNKPPIQASRENRKLNFVIKSSGQKTDVKRPTILDKEYSMGITITKGENPILDRLIETTEDPEFWRVRK